jgi:hypothetical protein
VVPRRCDVSSPNPDHVAVQNLPNDALVRLATPKGYGLEQKENPLCRISVGVVTTTDPVDDVVAERQTAEGAFSSRLLDSQCFDFGFDLEDDVVVLRVRKPVDEERPIDVASDGEFITSE